MSPATIALEKRLAEIMPLFQEARDALPAISLVSAKLLNVDLTLASRMDAVGTKNWRAALEAEAVQVEPSKDVILDALHEYHCSERIDEDGSGSKLVDVFTHGEDISPGISEIEALADFIWGALADAEPKRAVQVEPVAQTASTGPVFFVRSKGAPQEAAAPEIDRLRTINAELVSALQDIVDLDDGDSPYLWHYEPEPLS